MQDKLWLQMVLLNYFGYLNVETKTDVSTENEVNRWSGIAFEMMGQYFVAPLGEVSEVILSTEIYASTKYPTLGSRSSEYSRKITFSFRFGTLCFWAKQPIFTYSKSNVY